YSTHKHENVRKWLARNKRITLHFIPTSSSWLNLVERFFGLLTQKQLKRGVFTSVKELEAAIGQFIDQHNKDPESFVWTKSVDQILEKIGRAKAALQNV
ncbi:MAG: IS630 family transposase, partial [endosymbiont of Lamellibrachia luymesi]